MWTTNAKAVGILLGAALVCSLLNYEVCGMRTYRPVSTDGHALDDVRYVQHEFLDTTLPTFVAHGFRRSLAAVEKKPVIVLGYSKTATIQAIKGQDAWEFFDRASQQLKTSNGGELHIEAGTYVLSNRWEIFSSNTLVKGAGMDKTIIKLADMAEGHWDKAGFFSARKVSDVTVADLTFDVNKDNQDPDLAVQYGRYGTYMDEYKNFLYLRVKVQNSQKYGFDPHGVKRRGFIFSEGLTLRDCVSVNNWWDGFTFDQTIGIYVKNCTAIGNGRFGFNVITSSQNILMEDNVAIDNGFENPQIPEFQQTNGENGCGFMIDMINITRCGCPGFPKTTKNAVFRNNKAKHSKLAGFCANNVPGVTVRGNTITDTPYCGLFTNGVTGSWSKNKCTNTPKGLGLTNVSTKNFKVT